MRTQNILRGVAATALTLSALGLGVGTANAGDKEKDGYLTSTEFGLFCYEDQANSVFDLWYQDENFTDDWFKGSRSCAGQNVNDNTRSYLNGDRCVWYVFTNINMSGAQGSVPSGHRGNASATYKDQISSTTPGC
ncbi:MULTISPECIES: hypothetical protein [unclassified Streptomyces]|uniref:hypothetical protein n=1 Tax=unclassified Streptomyces TaxID=2593676 RepID=UPI002E14B770|nr:peptidase inhibitor family I36 protein [Streptomyces sp. NBC_01207]WTA19263.1 peptidase inhibitor family I36 protein [Streptomyces sp. NBC_00853]